MKVIDALNQAKPALSFEFFPPKTTEGEEKLLQVIGELKHFNPDFVSVTCGALGSTHHKTFYWVEKIKKDFGLEPVAHLTCVDADAKAIINNLKRLESIGVENVLALRGDPPAGQVKVCPLPEGFRYAKELVSLIRQHSRDLCVGVAGYPEGHVEAGGLKQDISRLKEKADAGADYIISQLFFDNRLFFDFLDLCRGAGIALPIIPGIMPITSVKNIKKLTGVCGASIPAKLLAKLEKHEADPKAVIRIGIEQVVMQCQELLKAKVPGLHFFVLNQSGPISEIMRELKPFLRR